MCSLWLAGKKIQTFWLAFGDPLVLTPAFPDNSLMILATGPGPHFKPDKIPQHQVTQYPQISQPRKPNSKEEIKKERD